LRDGRVVAVKVQRPGVKEQVLNDLEILSEIAELLDKNSEFARRHGIKDMVAEFHRRILPKLDYLQEAQNLTTLRKTLSQFDRIIVPQAVSDYTTSHVLTMESVHGAKVTSLTPIARVDVGGQRLAEELFHAYLLQILVDGFFMPIPIRGIFIADDGAHIALLDLGMVARISPRRAKR
jgi:predicted unusual protein kinase regulating ubiquinone biosynthesis (AarF/ABC1/UbiB family)